MESKYQTLLIIYELIKHEPNPPLIMLQPGQIIIRQNFPWDEIVNHLHELQSEGLVTIKQLSTAAISITAKGLDQITALRSNTAA